MCTDKETNNGSPLHGTMPCWPEAQLPPSLKGVSLLSPTPQVEKLRGRVDKQLPLPTNQEAQQDLNPELTVKKPLPATYLCCKGRCMLAEADRALRDTGTQSLG